MQIIPSILVQSAEEFRQQINAVTGTLDQIQLDIADGEFVPNTTWADPAVVKKEAKINVELHLMVARPLAEIKKWNDVSQITRALFHLESKDDIDQTIEAVHKNGWEASIVINPNTPVSAFDPYLKKIDGVMFMGVHPGFQGQKFIPEVMEKIRVFKQNHPKIFVEVDGGINTDVLRQLVELNVDAICPGSSVWRNNKPLDNIKKMEEIIQRLTK